MLAGLVPSKDQEEESVPASSLSAGNLWCFLAYRSNTLGFPGGSVAKNLPANTGDAALIPGLGRFPGEGNGNPLQYFCLGNPMD